MSGDTVSGPASHLHNDLKGKCTNFHVAGSIYYDAYVNGSICMPKGNKTTKKRRRTGVVGIGQETLLPASPGPG